MRGPEFIYRVGFLLMPEFSMSAVMLAIDTLRLANKALSKNVYSWTTLASKPGEVTGSNGLDLNAQRAFTDADEFDAILVCGGVNIQKYDDPAVTAYIRRKVAHGADIGAFCTGSFVLANAGLMNGYRCTIHWESIPALIEQFPDVEVVSELFVADRNRLTCAGGVSVIDLMLNIISQQKGWDVATTVADDMLHHRIRTENEGQRMDLRSRSGIAHPKLLRVIADMENNIETPLSCSKLANNVCLSTRQLERLFRTYLAVPPTKYYLRMRLGRARFLLQQTSLSIFDVALASGFISASHFSKCFREYFGEPPSGERRRNQSISPSTLELVG